ncbi:DUF6232 family protein [Pseudomonas sp. MMS21-TM103]|uniref:DUF6232 family protein n=1 Tax=Pseudomonas sp. MMS21 TM103 TaxID=2886506 RepID=UPI001EE07879|nr:DUF6232 family protein [Pseudomonas sp. MMS21 TM103]MCG4454468.1 DUF6232 family protein [Pseudomonas sp. MMS21 TM103]
MDEKIFFNQGNVSVSNSRFIVDGQTYAMSNVTSVKSGATPPDRGTAIIIAIIGLACLFGSGWVFVAGIVALAIAILVWIGSKAKYSVILNTSSGENQALVSEDESYISNVISSLNEAIVSRG